MNQRTLGATFLVAGTTIGAGMLALPMTSANFGFNNSVLLLVAMWVYMLLAAGIMVEISHGKGQSIAAIVESRLGAWAKSLAAASMLILFWSLLWCYISGGSSIVYQETNKALPISAFILIFTCLLSVFVVICTAAVDYANRFIFIAKVAVFVIILVGLFPFIRCENLATTAGGTQLSLHHVIPVFFTAYGFHGSIPSLISYLEGDKRSVYVSLIAGSFIPLVVYILWQIVTLGIIGNSLNGTEDVGLFINQLTTKTGNVYLTFLTNAFAFLAIATSFLGVALGLFDYISEWFKKKSDVVTRAKVTVLTFGLPLVLALIYPNGFIVALGCAAVALSLLAVVLPCLVALKEARQTSFLLNKSLVFLILLGGIAVIAIEVILKS
jgi:tyrosine-specific transport protein